MHNGKNSNNFGCEMMTICDRQKKKKLSQTQQNVLALLEHCLIAHPQLMFCTFWEDINLFNNLPLLGSCLSPALKT